MKTKKIPHTGDKNSSMDADCSTNTQKILLVGQNSPKNKLFPKDSKTIKSLDIGLQEVGAKKPLNGVRKWDKQTNTETDIRTFLLIEKIGTVTLKNHNGDDPERHF